MSPAPTDSPILLTERDPRGVLRLTLNRPEVHNAFGSELVAELSDVLRQAEDDTAVRVLVITGSGTSFSAGADLNWMRRMVTASAEDNEQDALSLAQMLRRLNYHAKPTIARINGPAFGGGLGLVACCDITLADEHARFALTEVRLGLVPAVISPYLVRRLGEGAARRWFQSAEAFDARRARELGLVQEVLPAGELDVAVEHQVDLLLRAGPQAIRQAKRLVFQAADLDRVRQRQLDQENARLIARLRVSPEGQEGLGAFLDKRRPEWLAKPPE